MLTAKVEDEVIVAPNADRKRVRRLSREKALACTVCEEPMIFRAGSKRIWHFAHAPSPRSCPSANDPDYRPETELHVRAKLLVYEWLREHYSFMHVGLEEYIPETGQIADVLLRSPETGRRIAFEVQRTPISGERWRERSRLYAEVAVLDVWLLIGEQHVSRHGRKSHGLFSMQDLAQTIYYDRGEVLILEIDAELEPASGHVVVLQGIGAHYEVCEYDLEEHILALNELPLQHRPTWLDNTLTPWSQESTNPASLSQEYVFMAPLTTTTVEASTNDAARILVINEQHERVRNAGWAWEHANHAWHRKQTRLLNEAEAARKRKRAIERRRLDRAIGSGVYAQLKSLLKHTYRLKKNGDQPWPESQLRNHQALPTGVQKWPPRLWSPFTNIPIDIDWIFGVDRRLWQMVVYCRFLFYPYHRYRDSKKHDLRRMKDRHALKVLADNRILFDVNAKKLEDLLREISAQIPRATPSGSGLSIELHDVRRLVMLAYISKLARHGLVEGAPDPLPDEVLALIRKALNGAYLLLQKAKTHGLSEEDVLRLGDGWASLAERIRCWVHGVDAVIGHYTVRTLGIPPYFREDVHERVTRSMANNTLHVVGRELYDGFEQVAWD